MSSPSGEASSRPGREESARSTNGRMVMLARRAPVSGHSASAVGGDGGAGGVAAMTRAWTAEYSASGVRWAPATACRVASTAGAPDARAGRAPLVSAQARDALACAARSSGDGIVRDGTPVVQSAGESRLLGDFRSCVVSSWSSCSAPNTYGDHTLSARATLLPRACRATVEIRRRPFESR